MMSTLGLIKSARCVLPGAFSDVPAAVTLNGWPEYALNSPLSCQPPASFDAKPFVAHRLFLPNGSSATNDALKLCVRSYGMTARASFMYAGIWITGGESLRSSQQTPSAFDHV